MSKTTGVFDWDKGPGGVSIVPTQNYITNAAMSEKELQAQIDAAKADLDAVGARAAIEIRKMHKMPLSLKVSRDA